MWGRSQHVARTLTACPGTRPLGHLTTLRVSCPPMNAEQINALGGWCELVGVGFLVRDLTALARYRGKLRELADRLKARWARVAAVVRAWWDRLWRWLLRRRPAPVTTAQAGVGMSAVLAGHATGVAGGSRGPFTPRPGQSVEDQIAELGSLVNRLREEVIREPQERERAITAERQARHAELRAEAERLERQVTANHQEVEGLREATTGDLGLKAESVVFLVLGIVLTTWSELFADWLPAWPPFRVAMLFLGAYLLGRVSWALWLRPRGE